ncbi:MAG: prepilin-type N-terminal cleavage/methylation domain-containing protein [Fuerstiella sp.]|nr:prepilin-type N-terminal cleavage/methylation domain-containing protein [Fuerstiella sp.]
MMNFPTAYGQSFPARARCARQLNHHRAGFTFVELMISLSLLSIFAVIINQMLMNVGRISWDSNRELLAFRTTSVVTGHLRDRINATLASAKLQRTIQLIQHDTTEAFADSSTEAEGLPETIRPPDGVTLVSSQSDSADTHSGSVMQCGLIGTNDGLLISRQVQNSVVLSGTFYGESSDDMSRFVADAGLTVRDSGEQIECFTTNSSDTELPQFGSLTNQSRALSELPLSIHFRFQDQGVWFDEYNSLLTERLPSAIEISVRVWPETPEEHLCVSTYGPQTFFDCGTDRSKQQRTVEFAGN